MKKGHEYDAGHVITQSGISFLAHYVLSCVCSILYGKLLLNLADYFF